MVGHENYIAQLRLMNKQIEQMECLQNQQQAPLSLVHGYHPALITAYTSAATTAYANINSNNINPIIPNTPSSFKQALEKEIQDWCGGKLNG